MKTNAPKRRFTDLLDLVSRLRAPDGCPWDRKQTPQSFSPYLIEEAHELAEAIDENDPDHIREELGDLLFQVAFLNHLYEEEGRFTMGEVIETITAKMIRRHPHVFGDRQAGSERELRQQWNAIKAQEKTPRKGRRRELPLTVPPKSLPALRRTQRITESALALAGRLEREEPLTAAAGHLARLEQASAAADRQAAAAALGELLLTLTRVAAGCGVKAEEALQAATEDFIERFARLVALLEGEGLSLGEGDGETIRRCWQRAGELDGSGS